MNYSEMSDFEINCAVAAYLGEEFFYNSPGEPGRRRKSFVIGDRCRDVYESEVWSSDVFAPCKSWADAGPIIQQNAISVGVRRPGESDEWIAVAFLDAFPAARYRHKNPLRAAMIVFLMMQESENA